MICAALFWRSFFRPCASAMISDTAIILSGAVSATVDASSTKVTVQSSMVPGACLPQMWNRNAKHTEARDAHRSGSDGHPALSLWFIAIQTRKVASGSKGFFS